MVYTNQTYDDGNILPPFAMNYMENAIESDLLVVQIHETSNGYTVDTAFNDVKAAILDGRLVIYMTYKNGNVKELLAIYQSQGSVSFIAIGDGDSMTASFKHYEDDHIQDDTIN